MAAGVFWVTPNGSMVEAKDIDTALAGFRTGYVLMVTTDQTMGADATVPAGSGLVITNNAVITLGAWNLTINGEFQKPSYACFDTSGGGTLSLPTGGPGALQDFEVKDLISNGDVSGVTGTFSGAVDATGGFTGDVTGNLTGDVTGDVTGNADTATEANPAGHILSHQVTSQKVVSGHCAANSISTGDGWSSVSGGLGISTLTFSPAFSSTPIVVATIQEPGAATNGIAVFSVTSSGCEVRRYVSGGLSNTKYDFIAIGTYP